MSPLNPKTFRTHLTNGGDGSTSRPSGSLKNGGAPGGRALPNQRFPIYEDVCYGRGGGVGLDRGTGVNLGVVVAVGVGVPLAVAVGVAVGVAVAVGLGAPDCAQYLPPVLR